MNSGNNLEDARTAFFDSVAHFEGNRLTEAEAAFRRALELAPGKTSVMISLGVTRVHLGKFAAATALLEAFEQAFARGTNSQNMRLQYVKCLFRRGAFEATENAIKEILAADARCAEACYQLV